MKQSFRTKGRSPLIQILTCFVLMLCFTSNGQDIEAIASQDPVRFRGALQFSSALYDAEGIDRRKPPFGYAVSGNLVFSLYGIDMPVSFLYSNYQRDFRQPFNYFGLSPKYKWITLHVGYRRIKFSPYTLNGHRFLGAGVELNPGKFRFGAIYGKFQSAVEEDSTYLSEEGVQTLPKPTYARKGYGVKVGVGSERNYIDLIYFKGWDDPESLDKEPTAYSIRPSENAIIGISTRLSVKDYLSWYAEVGASAFTRDQRQEEIEGDGESGIYSVISRLLTPNITSQASIAAETGVEFRQELWSAKFLYKRIDPGYRTMGSYYFQTDMSQYLLTLNLRTRKQKFRLLGSFGYQTDNVRENKLAQTNRTIGSMTINFNPSQKFGLNVQYSNFGVAQKPGLKSVSDTTRLRNVNQSLIISPRVTLKGDFLIHSFGLTGSYNDLNDKNSFTESLTEVQSLSVFLFYNILHVPTGISANVGLNQIQSTLPAGETRARGYSVGVSKAFFENKFRVSASYLRNSNKFEESDNGYTARARASLSYAPARAHKILLTFSHLKNESNNTLVSRSFTETCTRLSYTYRFDTKQKRKQ